MNNNIENDSRGGSFSIRLCLNSARALASALLAVFLSLSPVANADITEGLVLHYTFGGDATDQTNNGYDGQVVGATLAADRFGVPDSAYSFDGDDYIVTDATGLPEAERTVALWMLVTSSVTQRPIAVGYGRGCGSTWIMYVNEQGYRLITHCGGTPNILGAYGCKPEGVWTHFAVTIASDQSILYVDGVPSGSLPQLIPAISSGTQFAVGAATHVSTGLAPYVDVNIGYFIGSIDDVRVYDRALAAEDVELLAAGVGDQDADGVSDNMDNCVWTANPTQYDADGDLIGNYCDADLNNDCVVNPLDLGAFKDVFFTTDPAGDFNGDGVVNPVDLGIMKAQFFSAPGPSGRVNACRCVL